MCDCLYDTSVLVYFIFFLSLGFVHELSPHFACLLLHLARLSSSVTPIHRKFWKHYGSFGKKIGGTTSFRSELPKYVCPQADREWTYSIVGLPAFSDIMFPPFFTECWWCWCELIIAWREPGCQPCLIKDTSNRPPAFNPQHQQWQW